MATFGTGAVNMAVGSAVSVIEGEGEDALPVDVVVDGTPSPGV